MSTELESEPRLERERPASEGEGDSHACRKRIRRRRGNKRPKPYTPDGAQSEDGRSEAPVVRRRRSERLMKGRPMAPYNTTRFLLEDREQRADVDAADEAAYIAQERSRVRSLSVGSSEYLFDEASSSSGSAVDGADVESDKEEAVEHREFEDVYEEVQMDNLAQMNREELTREVLGATKDKDVILDELVRIRSENGRLKHLLQEHGIDSTSSSTCSTATAKVA